MGVGCHFLLQGNFLTQKLNPGLLHWQAVSLALVLPGKLVEWYTVIKFSAQVSNLFLPVLETGKSKIKVLADLISGESWLDSS